MFSRRLEINIMKSVGATNWFIRWPFMVEGMMLGFISAVVSLGAVWGIYKALEVAIYKLLGTLNGTFEVVNFTGYALYVLAAFVVIGVISGGAGSFVSIQKYLKERGGVVYDDED
jgi:cell division transport system permease protein